ncbi:hypothetical protein [Burkholderia gladioli]|uniref:hypothetical protein n=1 Tax=Burkholderia gladioli TaxID=28095 RepID=UPI00164050C8|nr:hypothetical protein [Burkholderia gladioli]
MQTIAQLIKAGADYAANLKGLTLFVQQCDQGDVLTITLVDIAGNRYTVQDIGAGAKLRPLAGFTSVQIGTSVDANVQFIITSGDIDIQNSQVEAVIANGDGQALPVRVPAGQRLPVDIGGGTVNVTASNVTVGNAPENPVPVSVVAPVTGTVGVSGTVAVQPIQATAITDAAPVAVPAFTAGSPNQVKVRAAGACRALRIANPIASTGHLYLGGSGVTPTNAVIALLPGDVWNETDAPQIDWYATSDTGATANIQVIA